MGGILENNVQRVQGRATLLESSAVKIKERKKNHSVIVISDFCWLVEWLP